MAVVGGQLTEMVNSGAATCFAGASAGNGPLAAFKGAQSAFTKLPIFQSEIFVPNSYKFGGFCSHAKVSGFLLRIIDRL